MTIRIQKRNYLDSILSFLKKERGLIIPKSLITEISHYPQILLRRESFLKALIRKKNLQNKTLTNDLEKLINDHNAPENRREILFCHDLLKFLENKYKGAIFGDDFGGQSRPEFYFTYKGSLFIVEAKGEVEADDSKHPGWKGSFQAIRDSIRTLPMENKYNKWLLYLAQLHDYISNDKNILKNRECGTIYGGIGLPIDKCRQFLNAISVAAKSKNIKELSYQKFENIDYRIAFLVFHQNELIRFFKAILTS